MASADPVVYPDHGDLATSELPSLPRPPHPIPRPALPIVFRYRSSILLPQLRPTFDRLPTR